MDILSNMSSGASLTTPCRSVELLYSKFTRPQYTICPAAPDILPFNKEEKRPDYSERLEYCIILLSMSLPNMSSPKPLTSSTCMPSFSKYPSSMATYMGA